VPYYQQTEAHFFFFWASSFIHCLAALDFGAGVEQPFGSPHRPEPSGRAVREKVDGLDIEGQHGRRFVLLPHTLRPQRRPYPICTSRSGNVQHQCGGGWAGPRLFLGGSLRGVYRRLELKCGVLWGCPPTPRSINDPPTAPHVCCCHRSWWVAVRWVKLGVSIWGAVHLHSMDG